MSDDLISRQAAIDELKEHRALYCDNTPDTFSKLSYAEKSRVDELDTAIATLVNLPSAQPEIIRCKDCRKNPNWEWVGCPMTGKDTRKPDDFCSYAERKSNG